MTTELKRPKSPDSRGTQFLAPQAPSRTVGGQFSMVAPSDLETYRVAIKQASASRNKAILDNRRPWHAATVIENIAEFAEREQSEHPTAKMKVDIVTGSCDNYFYGGKTAETLRRFVDKGGSVRVLVFSRKFDEKTSDLHTSLSNDAGLHQRAAFCVVREPTPENLTHFMVACGGAYRWESEDCNFHDGSFNDLEPIVEAKVCFGDTEISRSLHGYFDVLWDFFSQPVHTYKSGAKKA
jgi:hypothetical protein